jgi:hypothetical protein
LTTATILTLNPQVHVVLGNAAIFQVVLANVATAIVGTNIVENEDVFTVVGEWWKTVVFAFPFVLWICHMVRIKVFK